MADSSGSRLKLYFMKSVSIQKFSLIKKLKLIDVPYYGHESSLSVDSGSQTLQI